jgi:hypothetical protein
MKRWIALSIALLALAGSALAQQGGRGQGMRRGDQNSLASLLRRADVQAELGLTDEQKTKLGELAPQRGQGRGNGGGGGQQMSAEERRAQMAEREKATLAILNESQQKRVRELSLQRAGTRAIVREDVQKELGLSSEQVSKINSLTNKQREANQSLMERARNGEIERNQIAEIMQKNDKVLGDELGKILTTAQAEKLRAMGGKPFKFAADEN